MLNIGSHISAAGGFMAMGKEAVSLDANVFAFFTRNPRGGKAKKIDENDVNEFVALFFKFLTKDNDTDLNESIKKFMTDEEIDKIINRTLGE